MVADRYSLDIIEKSRKIPTTTLSDALDKSNIKGTIIGILPLFHGAKIAGPAFTVKEVPRKTDPAEFRVTEALDQAKPGSVLVFDVDGFQEASTWGGLASLSAKVKGVDGVVVNGAVRDANSIRELKFPVFARAVVPITGKTRIATVSFNANLEIYGVKVQPNDLVVGDDSGIVVVPHQSINEVLRTAEEILNNEERVERQIMKGKSVVQAERELKTRI